MTEQAATEIAETGVDDKQLPHHSLLNRLYTGTGAFEVIGRRNFYYMLTAALVAISLLSIIFRGFTLGIDFEGGSQIQFPNQGNVSTTAVEDVYHQALGMDPVSVQTVGAGSSATIQIRSEALNLQQVDKLQNALFDRFHPKDSSGNPNINTISNSDVSSTWGSEITKKALIALLVFLVLVTVYIAIRYERDMAIAAITCLFFDMTVTAGIYSIVGLEVAPATVIGLLTILGFSLYDSVVVFDKVAENTRGVLHLRKRTYAEQANLAINQTLMRSINTTLIGILPVIGLMVIAVWLLGVGTLKDLALVQLVGMIVGAYSSIFFATPLLVSIKERWGPVAEHTKKVLARRESVTTGDGAPVAVQPATVMASSRANSESVGTAPKPGARPMGKRHKRKR
ncbi:protein translocase subunit SecF [Skermania sp. ID1734]|uniref:protein translocase subunit SecF n=1 Tax=Skermania sp. ID1734 TaxID=2597516 RepID=UPI001180D957|nr:protein translocase subunit SecF [Skermania sp. ID1734]TSD94661.1 protein translocase subunit SecF [Skermania sp. ID1734]